MTKSKEVAVNEEKSLAVPELDGLFDLKENMEGVVPEFPAVKIIHQGQMFEMPGGDKKESFEGIIVDIARANAWWEQSFDDQGGGVPPDCFSLDGVVPSHDSDSKQAEDCATCEYNKFGSDGRGKACKNMKRMFVLIDGETFPFRLVISPSNLKEVDKYVTRLSSKRVPYQLAVTSFSLSKTTNKDGIEFSEPVFEMVKQITDRDAALRIKQTVTDLKQSMRGVSVDSSEVS